MAQLNGDMGYILDGRISPYQYQGTTELSRDMILLDDTTIILKYYFCVSPQITKSNSMECQGCQF